MMYLLQRTAGLSHLSTFLIPIQMSRCLTHILSFCIRLSGMDLKYSFPRVVGTYLLHPFVWLAKPKSILRQALLNKLATPAGMAVNLVTNISRAYSRDDTRGI